MNSIKEKTFKIYLKCQVYQFLSLFDHFETFDNLRLSKNVVISLLGSHATNWFPINLILVKILVLLKRF